MLFGLFAVLARRRNRRDPDDREGGVVTAIKGKGKKMGTRKRRLALVAAALCTALALAAPAASAAPARPALTVGCTFDIVSGAVCMYLVGPDTEQGVVTSWETSVANPFLLYRCSIAGYWVGSILIHTSKRVCSRAIFISIWLYKGKPAHFLKGMRLCSSWTGWAARVCETIK